MNKTLNEEQTYIARKIVRTGNDKNKDLILYENVFDGTCLLKSNNKVSTLSFIEETPLSDYLNLTQKMKSNYSIEDLEKILNNIEIEQEQSKKLVKTK